MQHYHEARTHLELDNTVTVPGVEVGRTTGPIECRERLGGVLRYDHRRAACLLATDSPPNDATQILRALAETISVS